MKTIEVIVMPSGESRVETTGFAGPACLLASRFLERVLGKSAQQQRTSEFYGTAVQQTTHSEQQL